MVRKSILVYDLLRTGQSEEGFTEKEIIERISNKHDITAGKGLKRQVAVALRRGLDFGIIAKRNNRFRFDPDGAKAKIPTGRGAARRSRGRKKKDTRKTATRQQSRASTRKKSRKRNRQAPQPKMPKSWTPNRRNLIDEPVSKVKKI